MRGLFDFFAFIFFVFTCFFLGFLIRSVFTFCFFFACRTVDFFGLMLFLAFFTGIVSSGIPAGSLDSGEGSSFLAGSFGSMIGCIVCSLTGGCSSTMPRGIDSMDSVISSCLNGSARTCVTETTLSPSLSRMIRTPMVFLPCSRMSRTGIRTVIPCSVVMISSLSSVT